MARPGDACREVTTPAVVVEVELGGTVVVVVIAVVVVTGGLGLTGNVVVNPQPRAGAPKDTGFVTGLATVVVVTGLAWVVVVTWRGAVVVVTGCVVDVAGIEVDVLAEVVEVTAVVEVEELGGRVDVTVVAVVLGGAAADMRARCSNSRLVEISAIKTSNSSKRNGQRRTGPDGDFAISRAA